MINDDRLEPQWCLHEQSLSLAKLTCGFVHFLLFQLYTDTQSAFVSLFPERITNLDNRQYSDSNLNIIRHRIRISSQTLIHNLNCLDFMMVIRSHQIETMFIAANHEDSVSRYNAQQGV